MKRQLTQQTTGSIRSPHRRTSFPKDGCRLLRCTVSEDCHHLLGRTEEAPARAACHSLGQALSWGCCRNLACGNRLTTRSSVGAKEQCSLGHYRSGLRLGGVWLSRITFASPVSVAVGSQVSCCLWQVFCVICPF